MSSLDWRRGDVQKVKQFIWVVVAIGAILTLAGQARAGDAQLNLPVGAQEPGMVRLRLAELLDTDPEGSVRLEMVVQGPLSGEGAEDLYAFNAILVLPSDTISFVPGSIRKGDVLGVDGGNWMVTAAAPEGSGQSVTMGGSRIGAVPGVAASEGSSVLCSFALLPAGPGPFQLAWENAAFIDSKIRRVEAARFVGASLKTQEEGQTLAPEDPE
jgi:hypothetical protein